MFSEIVVLIIALAIALTIILMIRKIFFRNKTNLKINKKVNSRDLFEPIDQEDFPSSDESDEFIENTDSSEVIYDEAKTSEKLFIINLENKEAPISYKNLTERLTELNVNFSDEGGWFRVYSEDHYFSLVNGLNPGKFNTEEENNETTALTLILNPIPRTNSVGNFKYLLNFAELLSKSISWELYDADRNQLTQQMVDHYLHEAEEFDLNNLA